VDFCHNDVTYASCASRDSQYQLACYIEDRICCTAVWDCTDCTV